ncbi:MAG: hypothetical protein RI911_299 [Candidatus Parcubacteria bacterium]|jgi:hypothetical protein
METRPGETTPANLAEWRKSVADLPESQSIDALCRTFLPIEK